MKNTLSLNLNTLFRRLYYKGKTVHSPYFTLYYQKANKGPVNRLGFTVSTKLGKAVVRNKIRRRLYESFRKYEPDLKTGYYMVIAAKHSAIDADFHSLCRTMGGVLKKADLFKDENTDDTDN